MWPLTTPRVTTRGLSSVGRALPLQGRSQGFESPRLHSRLRLGLHIHARRSRRRLRVRRAANHREGDGPGGEPRGRGDSRDKPGTPAAALRSAGLLQGRGQPGHHLLSSGQFLGDGLLGGCHFTRQPALSVTPAQVGRARLSGVQTQPDDTSGDIHWPDRRVCQAAGQPLSRGQPGCRLQAHHAPFCRPCVRTSSDCHHCGACASNAVGCACCAATARLAAAYGTRCGCAER